MAKTTTKTAEKPAGNTRTMADLEASEAEKREAEAGAADKSQELARQQAEALDAGEDGQEQAKAATEARKEAGATSAGLTNTGHSITEPKAAPVDYGARSHRRPMQRTLSPEHTEGSAVSAPVVNLPYGSQPRSVDPKTGAAPVTEAEGVDVEDVHHDDVDADTDRGSSAADRAARASA